MTLSRMFCEKFQLTPDDVAAQFVVHFLDQFFLGARAHAAEPGPPARLRLTVGPIVVRLERHEELGVVEARWGRCRRRAGRSAQTTDSISGIFAHDGPRTASALFDGFVQRNVDRKRAADPEVALFQLGHELAAQQRQQRRSSRRSALPMTPQRGPAILQAASQLPQVAALQPADQEIVAAPACRFLKAAAGTAPARRSAPESGPAEGEGVGIGHRAEDLPFGALHREQRQERADHDRGREEQALFHFAAWPPECAA